MKPMVRTNFSIPQDGINTHNSILEHDLDLCYSLSSTCHEYLYSDPLDQSSPPASFSHSLDFQVVGSNCDQVSSISN